MNTVADLVGEVAQLLNDAEADFPNARWSRDELAEYANDAVLQIVLLRADEFAKSEQITLHAGSRQELPDGAVLSSVAGVVDRFGNITGQAERTDGRAARVSQNWFAGLACPSDGPYRIASYWPDPDAPGVFYVDPPVPAGAKVTAAVTMTREPDEVGINDVLPIGRKFHNAVVEWMLYRAFSKDTDSGASSVRAPAHLEHFYSILGLEQKVRDRSDRRSKGVSNVQPAA